MIIRVGILSVLLLLNYTEDPSFWEIAGFNVAALLIMFLTMLPLIGWIVVIGCGYLTYNYLYNIHDWNIIIAILLSLIVSAIMGTLLSGSQQEQNS